MSKPGQQSSPASSSNAARTKLAEWAQQFSVEATPLGRGSFASVYKGIHRESKEPVAIKVMTKTRLGEKALKMLAAEVNILRTLEHPNVVCLRDSHSTDRRILIVLEFCGGGDLGQFIQAKGPSSDRTARHFMLQLAAGLAFLSSRRLIHRDIKPQNLLLSERSSRGVLKIADFGLARHLAQGSLAESMLGSPLYMAPEVLNNMAYDAKADLWSAGTVLFELVTAKHPFGGSNQVDLINNIRRNRPRLPPGITLSPACAELLGMLLVPQPADRASLQTFLTCSFFNPPRVGATTAAMTTLQGNSSSGGSGGGGGSGSNGGSGGSTRGSIDRDSLRAQHQPPPQSTREVPKEASKALPESVAVVNPATTPTTTITPTRAGVDDGDGIEPSCSSLHHSATHHHRQEDRVGSERPPSTPPPSRGWTRRVEAEAVDGRKQEATTTTAAAAAASIKSRRQPPADSNNFNSSSSPPSSAGAPERTGPFAGEEARRSSGGGDDVDVARARGSRRKDKHREGVAEDRMEGRNGVEWAWNSDNAVIRAGAGHRGPPSDSGIIVGIKGEGPLPELPALPFALDPFAGGRAEEGRRYSGDGGGRRESGTNDAPSDFAFDLAFAGSPMGGCSPASGDGVARDGRSFSANDAYAARTPNKAVVPNWSRRKRRTKALPTAAIAETAPAVSDSPPPATPPSARRRSKSFSGQTSPLFPAPLTRANTFSDPPGSSRTVASPSAGRGRSRPDPVFYLGNGGSVPAAGSSAAALLGDRYSSSTFRRNSSPPERGVEQQSGGYSTPPSPVYYNGAAVAENGDGRSMPSPTSSSGGASPRTGEGGSGQGQMSPARAYLSPVFIGGNQPAVPSTSPPIEASHSVLLKPSFRGGDSLLTIPEDSTGFVLVTRPSSIACEHGPSCECWAWSAGGGGGGGGGAVSSPSASYLATANPYGGPGSTAAVTTAERRSGGGGGAFLGLGNIWNTAMNTFRGVAGAHARRPSWPVRRAVAAAAAAQQQQQQRGSLANASSPTTVNVLGRMSTVGTTAVAVSSPREHLSPHRNSQQHYHINGAESPGGSSRGSSVSSRRGGRKNDVSLLQKGAAHPSLLDNSSNVSVVHRIEHSLTYHGGGLLGSPAVEASRRQPSSRAAADTARDPACHQQFHHQRRHSEPIARGVSSKSGDGSGYAINAAASGGYREWNPTEAIDSRRVRAAADRAEVAGKRSILIVTLADKAAQEAMLLALKSPRDNRTTAAGSEKIEEGSSPSLPSSSSAGSRASSARRRHGMLTEALSLYVKALAILQGALPQVLVECEGVPTEGFDAWNPLSVKPIRAHQQQQQQQQQRFERSSLSSRALLSQRSALITKASWLKELFSQTLQRAEHCRSKAASAAAAAASASLSSSRDGDSSSTGPGAPWTPLGSAIASPAPSDTAASAVYRSALENGQEAAVCYLLGRSDDAVTHYVRARALLQLLALEPEMASVGARQEDGLHRGVSGAGDGSAGRGGDERGGSIREEYLHHQQQQQQQQQQQLQHVGSWQAQLLLLADCYARRVELIGRGDAQGSQQHQQEGEGVYLRENTDGRDGESVEGEATVPPGFIYTT